MAHVSEELSAYIDGQLPAGERERVDAHLKACGECRAELGELQNVSRLMAALPRKPLPAGFMERLERRRAQEKGAEKEEAAPGFGWLGLPPRRLAFSMATVLVAFVAFEYSRTFLKPGSPEPAVSRPASSIDAAASSVDRAAREEAAKEAAGEMAQELASRRLEDNLLSAKRGRAGAFSNEQQHAYIEEQKKAMGIVKVLERSDGPSKGETASVPLAAAPPDAGLAKRRSAEPGPMNAEEARRYMAQMSSEIRSTVARMQRPAAPINGSKPALLHDHEKGLSAPIESADEAAAAPTPLARRPARAKPPASAAPPSVLQKWVVQSPQDRLALEKSLTEGTVVPAVDFARSMLIAIVMPGQGAEIVSVDERDAGFVVRYRLQEEGSGPAFRVLQRTMRPVNFEEVR